tara:strand:- start:49 stop:477 length:429 start_codon:yes stop_codon:yes gene_type:complete
MSKKQNTEVTICYNLKIKELAQQIYCNLEPDEIICLFTELNTLYSDCYVWENEWNDLFQTWLTKNRKLNIEEEIEQIQANAVYPELVNKERLKKLLEEKDSLQKQKRDEEIMMLGKQAYRDRWRKERLDKLAKFKGIDPMED